MTDSDKDADCLDLHDSGVISDSHEREDRVVADRKKCHKDKNKHNQPKKSILGKRKRATDAPSPDEKTTRRKNPNIANESEQRGKKPESQRKQSHGFYVSYRGTVLCWNIGDMRVMEGKCI